MFAESLTPDVIDAERLNAANSWQAATAKRQHEETALQEQIDATERWIDRLVFELYGLTEGEIRIGQGSV